MTGSIFGRPEQWTGQPFSLEEIDDPASDSTPPISLRSLKSALRRRRRVWVTAAAIGLLLGAALHMIVPSKYAAVTRLYLVEPSVQAMQDDVTLLQTRSVENRATGILHDNAGSDEVLSPYKGLELSPSILEIKVSGKSPSQAVTQSNALATAFLRVRADVLSQQTQVLVNRAQDQVKGINVRLQQLAEQISTFPANPSGSQASQLADLVNQRNGYSSQLTQIQNQVQQEKSTEASLTQGSTVLDPGRYVPASKKKVVIKDALAGLVAGLALGMVIVIIGALFSDRVRRRADVAAALGTTVELSVGHLPHPRFLAGPRLRRALKRPGPDLRRIEHRLRDHLESTPIAGLSLVEIGAGDAAALALAALAISLASEGKRVMLFDAGDGRPLGRLLGQKRADEQGGSVVIDGHEMAIYVPSDDPDHVAWMDCPEDADVILTLATVDPALGAEHISTSVSDVVVMIRAGAASVVRIDAVGQLLRQAIIGIRSAILIDADPDDHTSGLVAGQAAGDDSPEHSLGALKAVGP